MRRPWALGLLLASLTLGGSALAGPDPAKLRIAADEFDAGSRAYQTKDYESAASHFEAADAAVPSPKALRLALRSRTEAGQGSRAATLAALALARYPSDPDLGKLAKDALDKFGPKLHKLSVGCASPCVVAVGSRAILGEATTRWTVYLDPGKTTISASFFGDAGTSEKDVDAQAGGSSELRFEPEDKGGGAAAAPAGADGAGKPDAPSKAEEPPGPAGPEPDTAAPKKGSGLSPAFFVVGLVATAGLGGVTIWSGIDTQNDPGTDVVRKKCRGKGESCPEYQTGKSKETRTNVLIGATAGAGALTIALGAFLTNWGGGDKPKTGARAVPLVLPSGAGVSVAGEL